MSKSTDALSQEFRVPRMRACIIANNYGMAGTGLLDNEEKQHLDRYHDADGKCWWPMTAERVAYDKTSKGDHVLVTPLDAVPRISYKHRLSAWLAKTFPERFSLTAAEIAWLLNDGKGLEYSDVGHTLGKYPDVGGEREYRMADGQFYRVAGCGSVESRASFDPKRSWWRRLLERFRG